MNREDAGLELFKVQDVMLIKKAKHLLGHLREGGWIGGQIRSNIVQAQIYSGMQRSVLQLDWIQEPFWSKEICHEIRKLGGRCNIDHCKPSPLLTEEITIIAQALSMYKDMTFILKINEMRMQLNIIYLSEIIGELYNHRIRFPPVEETRLVKQAWKKIVRELNYRSPEQSYIGNIQNVQWWRSGDKVSNGSDTYKLIHSSIFRKTTFISVQKDFMVHVYLLKNDKLKVLKQYKITDTSENMPFQNKIEELKQFNEDDRLKMYTDVGMNLTNGESGYGIIIKGQNGETNIKAKLPQFETKGAPSAEHLLVSLGLKLLHLAGIDEASIQVFNNNTEVIRTATAKASFKELVGDNGWGKYKLWQEMEKHKKVAAEWSGITKNRSTAEQSKISKYIHKCHTLAHEDEVDRVYNDVNLSLMRNGKVEAKKIGSSIRGLLGDKYVTTLLEEKMEHC